MVWFGFLQAQRFTRSALTTSSSNHLIRWTCPWFGFTGSCGMPTEEETGDLTPVFPRASGLIRNPVSGSSLLPLFEHGDPAHR